MAEACLGGWSGGSGLPGTRVLSDSSFQLLTCKLPEFVRGLGDYMLRTQILRGDGVGKDISTCLLLRPGGTRFLGYGSDLTGDYECYSGLFENKQDSSN